MQSPTCTVGDEMPEYSSFIQNLLDKGDIMGEWEKFIEETAYFALKQSAFNTKDHYDTLGRRMVHKYECVSFFSKDKARPWVSIMNH